MSHFIQDTQCVIKTKDEKYIVLLKGGDNNVCSMETNKRCTSWSRLATFGSKSDYDTFIDSIMLDSVNGGGWQFQSMKGKSYSGFSKYDNLVYRRFNNAFKQALYVDFDLADLTVENLNDFERTVEKLMLDANFSLTDQDSNYTGLKIYYRKSGAEEEAVKGIKKLYKFSGDREKLKGYRDFCAEYADIDLYTCFASTKFLEGLNKFRGRWGGLDYLTSYDDLEISNEGMMVFLKGKQEELLDFYRTLDRALANYPEQFLFVLENSTLLSDMKVFIDGIGEEGQWKVKSYNEQLAIVEDFLESHEQLIKNKKTKLEEAKKLAPEKFVETWNDLVTACWYKTTKSVVARAIEKLAFQKKLGGFELSEVADLCDGNLRRITDKHLHQKKVNQPAIKNLAKELLYNYTELLDDADKNELSRYFDIELKIVEPEKSKEIVEHVDSSERVEDFLYLARKLKSDYAKKDLQGENYTIYTDRKGKEQKSLSMNGAYHLYEDKAQKNSITVSYKRGKDNQVTEIVLTDAVRENDIPFSPKQTRCVIPYEELVTMLENSDTDHSLREKLYAFDLNYVVDEVSDEGSSDTLFDVVPIENGEGFKLDFFSF